MTRILFFLLLLPIAFSCSEHRTSSIKRKDEPIVYEVEKSDPEMVLAMNTARKMFGKFKAALQENNPKYTSFSIKIGLESPNGLEHVWMANIYEEKGLYYGIVSNTPVWVTNIQLGDTMELDLTHISDWKYLDENVLIGGYTIRVLRNRMSLEERTAFDNESGMIIK